MKGWTKFQYPVKTILIQKLQFLQSKIDDRNIFICKWSVNKLNNNNPNYTDSISF